MKKILTAYKPISTDLALLVLRLMAGGSMVAAHGLGKLNNFGELSGKFYDFIGLGPLVSLSLTVFAEFFCATLVMLGLFTRLALIPLMITMAVAVFMVHGDDPFGRQELGLFYAASYLALFLAGPGRFSLDRMLLKR